MFTRHSFANREAEFVEVHPGEQMFPFSEENRPHGQMHFINLAARQELANHAHTAIDGD